MSSPVLLHPGVQYRLLNEQPVTAGSVSRDINLQSDAILVTLFATSVTGTLDLDVYATAEDGQEALLFSFPQLSAATTNLLLRRSSVATSRIRIAVSYSDACVYNVHVRAVNSGSSDTRILGSESFEVSQITIGTTPVVLIPSALNDRSGLVIKNWSSTQTLYIAETSGKASASVGYPLAPKDALAMDVAAGVTIYAVSDAPGADVRLAQVGG
jgi:hypothetical protein